MIEYWKARLGRREQELYTDLCDALSEGKLSVDIPRAVDHGWEETMEALVFDHPEFYFLSQQYTVGVRGSKTRAEFRSLYSPRQMAEIERGMSAAVSEIRRSLSGGFEDAEKKVAAYVISHTVYEQDEEYNQNAASALFFHRAQCSGIAKAVKYLMDRLGRWCIVLKGTLRDDGGPAGAHAWNIVSFDGRYYHLDATAMLGSNPGIQRGEPVKYFYFNNSDAAMRRNHGWNAASVPACTDTRYDNIGFGAAVGESIDTVSISALKAYFTRKGGTKFRFYIAEKGTFNQNQQKVMSIFMEYCRDRQYAGRANLSCTRDVWEAEIVLC